jgi:hypothetical protein
VPERKVASSRVSAKTRRPVPEVGTGIGTSKADNQGTVTTAGGAPPQEAGHAAGYAFLSILKSIGAVALVVVDDEFVIRESASDILPRIRPRAADAAIRAVLAEFGIRAEMFGASVGDDPEWELVFRESWDRTDREVRQRLLDLVGGGPRDLVAGAASLEGVLGAAPITRLYLGPSEWMSTGHAAVTGYVSTGTVVCLFDLDLSKTEGFGPLSGAELLAAAESAFRGKDVLLGLLSSRFPVGQEEERRRGISKHVGIPEARFVTLAKARLDSTDSFAEGIQILAMNAAVEELKAAVLAIVKKAADDAVAELERFSVWDFYETIIRSSQDAGAWEVDTLFRMVAIGERIERRRQAFEARSALEGSLARIRDVQGEIELPQRQLSAAVVKRRQAEFYDSEQINGLYLAVELGDLFVTKEGKWFVLLEAECDLVLRKDGSRALAFGTLVPVKQFSGGQREHPEYYPAMDFFPASGGAWEAHFKDAFKIDLTFLDLACARGDGKCEYSATRQPAAELRKPEQARAKVVRDSISATLSRLTHARESGDADLYAWVLPAVTGAFTNPPGLIDVTVTEQTLKLNLKRRGRLLNPHATQLLLKLHAYQSRVAFDHDFLSPSTDSEVLQSDEVEPGLDA